MNQRINDINTLQSENVLKISCNVTIITDEDQWLKSLLDASNDSHFLLTSNPCIRQVRDKWYVRVTRRERKENK